MISAALILLVLSAMGSLATTPHTATGHTERIEPSIEAYDNSPLGTRMPLLMIHGIQYGDGVTDKWDFFIKTFEANADFRARYKIYLYHYNPKTGVAQNSKLFNTTLTSFINSHGVGTMRIVAHSMGGLMVRDDAADPVFVQHVDRVISIATPFHGTPLTARAWISSKMWRLSPMRAYYRGVYGVVHHVFHDYVQDYAWDNFDGELPGNRQVKGVKAGQPAVQYIPVDLIRTHWILYAGFSSRTRQSRNWLAGQLGISQPQIRHFDHEKRKHTGWLNCHRIMQVTRNKMCRLIPAKRGHGYPMMQFNDGIIPIGSQLWLGEFGDARREGQPLSDAEQIERIQSLNGISGVTARVFSGIDHNDWTRGTTRYRNPAMTDWLHPQETPKTAEDWVLKDLLN